MSEHWTTENIPDLTGKVIIVTGANNGIGYEAAKEFARKGAQTILACRNMEKAQSALDQILAEVSNAPAEIMQLDLASLKSVHQFAQTFKVKYNRLDVLLNNAGIMMVPYGKTEDGFEKQLRPILGWIMQSAAMGALPSIRAAVDPSAKGGQYYGPNGFREFRGYPVIVQSSGASHNPGDAKKLWQVSEELTGVQYL